MKKAQAEAAIRSLIRQWCEQVRAKKSGTFHDFLIWLRFKGYGHYLEFGSFADPERDARIWFDDEIKQRS